MSDPTPRSSYASWPKVLVGDWVVRGVEGIWYPVHDEVWRKSYDLYSTED